MASRYHPDKNNNDPKAKAVFQSIQEAYEILSDFEKRQKYDETGEINDGEISITDVCLKMIFEMYLNCLEENGYRKKDYLSPIIKALKMAVKTCEKNISEVDKKINQLKYFKNKTESKKMLNPFFEEKESLLKDELAYLNQSNLVILQSIDLIKSFKYNGINEQEDLTSVVHSYKIL